MPPTPFRFRPHPVACAILALTPLLLVAPALAQDPPPRLSKEFFQGRRAELMRQLGEGIVLLRGAPTTGDMGTFYQTHDFWYLSGVDEPNVAMLLFPAVGREVLLVPPFNRFTAQWDGVRLAPGQRSAEITGFQEVGNVRRLEVMLDEALAPSDGGKRPVLWTILQPEPGRTATANSVATLMRERASDPFDGRPSREAALAQVLKGRYQGLEIRDLTPVLHRMRGVKQPEEIAAVEAATAIAVAGIAEAMKSAEPGIFEYQLAAVATYVFQRLGAGPDAYGAIVGSGPNGCVLHYMANSRRTQDGDLVVMDHAPTVNHYCSDVTRTFPIGGTFTDAQRKLVQDVHDVQQDLIQMIRPGVRISALGRRANELLKQKGYTPAHGPSHHVGLAVHDVGGDVLQAGMLITVEPGAYLPDRGMGCRIEDVVLVTAEGCVNLSAALPSTPDAIEELMRERGVQQVQIGLPAHESDAQTAR